LGCPIMTAFRYVPYVACVALDGNPALVCMRGTNDSVVLHQFEATFLHGMSAMLLVPVNGLSIYRC